MKYRFSASSLQLSGLRHKKDPNKSRLRRTKGQWAGQCFILLISLCYCEGSTIDLLHRELKAPHKHTNIDHSDDCRKRTSISICVTAWQRPCCVWENLQPHTHTQQHVWHSKLSFCNSWKLREVSRMQGYKWIRTINFSVSVLLHPRPDLPHSGAVLLLSPTFPPQFHEML